MLFLSSNQASHLHSSQPFSRENLHLVKVKSPLSFLLAATMFTVVCFTQQNTAETENNKAYECFFFLIKYNYLFPSFLACLAAKKVEDKRFTYPQSCSYKIPNLSHSSSLLYFERCILKYRCKTMFSPKIYNKNGDFIYFLLFELVGSFISFP